MSDQNKVCVFDIQKFSVHDGPGIRTIVFTKGCPLDCQWCANPESQKLEPELMYYPDKCIGCGRCIEKCPNSAIEEIDGMIQFDKRKCNNCGACVDTCYSNTRKMTGAMMSVEDIIKEADKDIPFYRNSGGGITFSGGEALLYPEFVKEIAKSYKDRGISVAVETCGCVPWHNFERIIDYLDLVMFDLKIMDNDKHEKYCGGPNTMILENLEKVSKVKETIVRVPIIPGINDSKEEIDTVGRYLKNVPGAGGRVHILAYHNFGVSKYNALGKSYLLNDIKAPEDEYMQEIKKHLESYDLVVQIGG